MTFEIGANLAEVLKTIAVGAASVGMFWMVYRLAKLD